MQRRITLFCLILLTCGPALRLHSSTAMCGVAADFQAWAGNGGAGVSFGGDSTSQDGKGSMPGGGGMGWRRHRGRRQRGSSDDSSSSDGSSPSSDDASGAYNDRSAGQSGADGQSAGGENASDASAGGDISSGDASAGTTGSDAASSDAGTGDTSASDVSSGDIGSTGGDASGDTQGSRTGRPVVTMTRIAHATVTVVPGQDAPKSSEQPASTPATGDSSSGGSSSDSSSQPSQVQPSSSPAESSSQPAQAEASPAPASSGMSADDTQALALQNAARKVVGVPPLSWSPMLVSVAKSWAETLKSQSCAFKHSGGKYGENLAMGTSDIAGAINMFLGEKANYNNQAIGGSMSGSNGQSYGHYTQVIWKSTTTVGCYYEPTCKLTVCNYDPAGNMIGSTPTKG